MITILIVDDEKLERRGIRFLLKREEGEFQILEATNGKDALGVLESNHVDRYFIFGCKDALYEWTGADESSERRSSGYGNRDLQRI